MDDRDHHCVETKQEAPHKETRKRLASMGVLGALSGSGMGILIISFPIPIGHPLGLTLMLKLPLGQGPPVPMLRCPLKWPFLCLPSVVLHLQGLYHVQEPLPIVRGDEALWGFVKSSWVRLIKSACETFQRLTVFWHSILLQPVCHLLG